MKAVQAFLASRGMRKPLKRARFITLVQSVACIPWGEGRTIEEVLRTKHVGTCTGKHLVLQACLEMLGIPSRTIVCTFHWSEQGIALPEHLRVILAEGESMHGHNFLQIQNTKGQWIDVDVTWDPALKPYGFRTFPEDWDGVTPFVGLDPLLERWDDAPLTKKQEWLRTLTPETQERRERFLRGFCAWVKTLR